jgi:hypothetical protein
MSVKNGRVSGDSFRGKVELFGDLTHAEFIMLHQSGYAPHSITVG